ncbi:MAG: recombinase family protein [Lachnospiraceae bacterium]|nr:recombinase family protein [Lachnospiraceae bacterium]
MSEDGELMLSLLASFAQEESRSISDNCKWGIRKRFESGEIGTANKHILGYRYDEEQRKYIIIPEEAVIVRRIVELYLERISLRDICDDLNARGWRTINGCLFQEAWIAIMLRNEVYAGDTLRQKSYMADPITKNKVKNKGEFPKYYMPDTHEAIIDRETWAKVQEEIARRESLLNPTYCFTGKIKCGVCGRSFSRNPNIVKGKAYPRWLCRAKKEGGVTCLSVSYPEKKLKEISTLVLGLEAFDENVFEEQVRDMTVNENGDIVFKLTRGETKTWIRPPKPPKIVKEKKPPEHCFDRKIFCGACGCRFGRAKSDTKDHHLYWYCRAKSRHGVTCDSVNYPDAELKDIFCRVMETERFDEECFNETVDRIVIQKTGSVDFHLKDGTLRTFKALKLRGNRHISTSTDEFTGKIRCAACGNLFRRSVHYEKYVYWHCSGKNKARVKCKTKNIADNEIRQVAAYVMELDEFDASEFDHQIKWITVEENGSMEFTFYDGRRRLWER